jgi:dTMP kinase
MRSAIKDGSLERDPKSNVGMLTVSRREGANQIIRPAVEAGKIVLGDRSWFSTIAYQGFGEGVPIEYIVEQSRDALGEFFTPDLAIVLRVPFELVQERMLSRGGSDADYFESKGPEFFKRVLAGYDWICEQYGAIPVDGSRAAHEVHLDIRRLLSNKLYQEAA